MKTYCLIMALTFCPNIFASYTHCPDQVTARPNYHRAWEFLKKLPPRFKVDGCTVELHVCVPPTSNTNKTSIDDDIIGDLLITNPMGLEQYMTFIFPKEKSDSVYSEIDSNETWIRYRFSDSNFDEFDGARQKAGLDIVMSSPDAGVKRLVAKTYTSNDHNHILGFIPASIWSICEPEYKGTTTFIFP